MLNVMTRSLVKIRIYKNLYLECCVFTYCSKAAIS